MNDEKRMTVKENQDLLKINYPKVCLKEYLEVCLTVKRLIQDLNSSEEINNKTNLSTLSGLCYMLKNYCTDNDLSHLSFYNMIFNCQRSWRYYSGNMFVPVPEDRNLSAWDGGNLKLRKNLLDHLILCLDS